MPEMPEVEVTRLSLAPRIRGGRVTAVHLGKPLRWPLGCAGESLVGQTVGDAVRRGKYIWLPLERGGLLLHLGMSGSLHFADHAAAAGAHDHFDLVTTAGTLRLTDPRRFGAVVWSPAIDADPAAKLLSGLGLEISDPAFTGAYLHAALTRRSGPIKLALLAGEIVVGAGNIYACEALFTAGIDPRARSNSLSKPRCERLADAVRYTLARAVVRGGTTLRDFRDTHGKAGEFQTEVRVYGREGQPCAVCAGPVRRIVQAQRASYFCPRCQRR
jgi:formamidopyrimidine-DNA glycosylase